MKMFKCIVFIFINGFIGFAKADRLPVEAIHIRGVAADLSVYESSYNGLPANTWQDIVAFFGDLQRIDVEIENGKRFTEIYSLVPAEEGKKFPEGTLICVRYEPAAWPAMWSDDPKKKEKDAGDLNREKPIRYLVYKNQRGDILSTWWYEEKIQAMLAKTGLTIPPPTPYHPPSPMPPGEKPAAPSTSAAPLVASQTAPVVAPAATPTPTTALVAPPPAKSSKLIWWIVCAIAALAAVVLTGRRKKPKA
jgi:hypothetical protein